MLRKRKTLPKRLSPHYRNAFLIPRDSFCAAETAPTRPHLPLRQTTDALTKSSGHNIPIACESAKTQRAARCAAPPGRWTAVARAYAVTDLPDSRVTAHSPRRFALSPKPGRRASLKVGPTEFSCPI